MKRKDLIELLLKAGFRFYRSGSKHDIYKRGEEEEQVPRHREINEILAKRIIRKWNL
ncbi:MAG: type II toxin-antitoxin system HicA family toxin [Lachnospiraceae bacterium]|nr:type II toxin-antitoxin system HicA family toxin [Lachnospiraceae bacterium]